MVSSALMALNIDSVATGSVAPVSVPNRKHSAVVHRPAPCGDERTTSSMNPAPCEPGQCCGRSDDSGGEVGKRGTHLR